MIRAVAFDLDGTLIDTAPDLGDAANAMLNLLGRKPLREDRFPTFIGAGISDFVAKVLAADAVSTALNPALLAGAEALFRKLYAQRLFERSRVYPGVRNTLHSLKESGFSLCCITNKESPFTLRLLAAADLHSFFHLTLCADLIEDRKPSPNLLVAACAQLEIAPEHLLYVGDARSDIIAARAAGCRVAAVTYGYHKQRALDELHPDETIDNIAEIGAPRFASCASA
jgi:phosphoglycolate phosphatase